jgi:23S rRNA (guanosine2251-2'-O)-methyltransferase
MTEGNDPSPILGEIDRLAREAHVPVRLVSSRRLESVQGTDAPQGVVAFAEPLTAASLDELVFGWDNESASSKADLDAESEIEIEDEDDEDEDDEGFFVGFDDADDDADGDVDFPVLIEFVDETDEPGDDEDTDIVPLVEDIEEKAESVALEQDGDAAVDSSAESSEADDHDDRTADAIESIVEEAVAAATAKPPKASAPVEAPQANAFLVLLEGVTDPQNLGAILRSAECAGATGVAVPRHRSVHVTPAVTKAAAGAIEHLQMALVAGMPSALQELEHLGVMTVGLDERGTASLYDLDLGDRPVALVLGSEGSGLSPLSRRRCEVLCRIPVDGEIPSLNVSAAAAVACFEVARQRGARKRR